MKNLKITISILVLSIFAISCSKSDDAPAPKTFPEENFLQGFLSSTGLLYRENTGGVQYRELAFTFKPLVKGKINAINLKTPQEIGFIYYRIWDKSTGVLIRPFTKIEGYSSNIDYKFAIDPIVLEKNKEYIFAVHMTNWRNYTKANNGAISFPVTSRNITILDNLYNATQATSVSNYTSITDEYKGDFSFSFQQTE
jgi:hypothetical protein